MKVVVMLTKVFFREHPKGGQDTHFADLVRNGGKIHTCRDNPEYWIKKIERLKADGGTLSIREWEGKPYRSRQITVVDIPAEKVGVSEITVTRYYIHVLPTTDRPLKAYRATINDKLVQTRELARNDGFSRTQDFVDFIDPLFDKYQSETIRLAIIHFTDFRY